MGRHRAGDGVRAPWQEGAREALTAVGLDPGSVRDYVLVHDNQSGKIGTVDIPIDDATPTMKE